MPCRNESSRYLHSAISHALEYLDELLVYDDQSDDDSYEVALNAGATVVRRPDDVPSFLSHEGKFRQASYDMLSDTFQASTADWVLSIDADEALVADHEDTWSVLEFNINKANYNHSSSCVVPIPEIFGYDSDGTPMRRVDGEWGKIAGTRLFRWVNKGRYESRAMASGAEPVQARLGNKEPSSGLFLLHYGYADERDQRLKYERYTSLADHGHLNSHVQSIVGKKSLVRWEGISPAMVRGDEMLRDAA
jgi:glycosyltransferase involved in cell wall biosynthesis